MPQVRLNRAINAVGVQPVPGRTAAGVVALASWLRSPIMNDGVRLHFRQGDFTAAIALDYVNVTGSRTGMRDRSCTIDENPLRVGLR
jgi:hypothetical protein